MHLVYIIIGALLLLDGAWLMALHKFNLGVTLPAAIGAVLLLIGLFYEPLQEILASTPRLQMLWRLLQTGFAVWLLTVALFFNYLYWSASQQAEPLAVKAIIVLGSGIDNGRPSAALQSRLDAAAPIAAKNPQAILILSGGMDAHEKISEAAVMQRYLSEHYSIAPARMHLETHSTSTALNLRNSSIILQQLQIELDQPIAIVSNDFHLPRALAIAKKQSYTQVYAVSAPTPLYIRYNSWLREYFAFISGWVLREY